MKIIVFLFGISLLGQTKAEAPKVPAEMEAEYYRSDALVAHVQAALEQANADLRKAVEDIKKACGDKADPSPQGKHIVCVARPDPPKK